MLRREDDGESLFGRFAPQTHRGASAGRRKSGSVGAAIPRQRGLGQEGVGDVSTQRQLGAATVGPARSAQQIYGGDTAAGGRMDRRAARSDLARGAVAAARRVAAESEYRAVVESVAGVGAALKKKSLYAAEQDTAANRQRRSLWREQVRRIDPERLIFLDESSVATEMTRCYGRARRGRRVREGVPAGRWRTLSVLGAIRRSGWVAGMTIEAPTDGEILLAYLQQVLGPQLQPGDVVVMDNLAAHKVAGVRESIPARGAPSYSICHPTGPTSTPSNRAGLNSSNNCAAPRPARLPRSRHASPLPSPL